MTAQAQVDIATRRVLALGAFPSGSPDPATIEIADLTPEQEEAIAADQPGQRLLGTDGAVTILPPDPGPQQVAAFERAEDTERLAIINERARLDPAFAALADIVLRGLSR